MNRRLILSLLLGLICAGCAMTPNRATRQLWAAVDTGDLELAREAIELADLERQNRFGMTPLHGAVRDKNSEMVRLLLNAGANPDGVDDSGYTPLSVVMDLGIARMLLDAGASACRVTLLQKIIVTDRSRVLVTREEAAELQQIIHLVQWGKRRCGRR